MFDIYAFIVYPLIYIFPAYAANASPVLLNGGGPLDFNRKLNGKRILGNHKTIIGTITGIAAGSLAGLIESAIFGLPYMLAIGIALAFGAMAGDLIGSFIKRRMDLSSGHSVPILDQYGFFFAALIFAYPLGNQPQWYGLLFIAALTGILHLALNIVAHRLKLKKVPW